MGKGIQDVGIDLFIFVRFGNMQDLGLYTLASAWAKYYDYDRDGTTGSHWEERILLGDIMNGVVYLEEQVISEFTLAVLDIINLIIIQGVYCNLEKIKDVNF